MPVVRENLAGLEGHGKLLNKNGYDNIHTVYLTVKIKDMYMGTEQEGNVTLVMAGPFIR